MRTIRKLTDALVAERGKTARLVREKAALSQRVAWLEEQLRILRENGGVRK